jgi:hypothetical protein
MNIKRILFPFSDYKASMETKWWHRLFVVTFALLIFSGALIALPIGFIIADEGIGSYKINSKIFTTLNDFTAKQDTSISDTVSLFTKEYSKIGCLQENGKINRLHAFTLERGAFCSADVRANLSSIADQMIETEGFYHGLSLTQQQIRKDNFIEGLERILSMDTEKRYCFVHHDVLECSSHNVVAYKHNIFFYAGWLAVSLVALYLFSLFLQFLYFKGLLYIIYGKLENKVEKRKTNPNP